MHSLRLRPTGVLALALAAASTAFLPTHLPAQEGNEQAPPAPVKIAPSDALRVIEELGKLRAQREEMRLSAMDAGIKRIQLALASELGPVELYQDCIKSESYTGQSDSMNSEYRDWKDRSRDQLKDADFRKCLRAHLQYLALSLEYLAVQETAPQSILPKVSGYLADLDRLDIPDRGPANELMFKTRGRDALENSVFVKSLNLDTELKRLKGWEKNPGNVSGIEENTVLPLLRNHHKDQLLAFWDHKINRERAEAGQAALASTADDFQNRRLPSLEWQKAEDMLLLGKGEAAYREMFRIVKNNPGHPEFVKWADTLEGYIKASLPTPPAGATTAEDAAPSPTGT